MQDRCLLRRNNLPLIPCDEKQCDWYIHDQNLNNCFWLLADILDEVGELTVEEIAALENTSEEEIEALLEKALKKCRENIRKYKEKF